MKYSLEKKDQYAVFDLQEENLNSLIAPKLKSEFIFLRNEGVPNLILDLSDVKYVDSSGLSAILTANRLWQNDGLFLIAGINHASVRKIIEISRLDTILSIEKEIADAVKKIDEHYQASSETDQ
ncbi:MAG: STAS domain-containing protein [Bacteroidetes bacterium]|jgi:anti-anti-sigma factor|nr:STAS domain-containing protein [Bacteroidota bacterium]